MINFDYFSGIEMRVGKISRAERFEKADKPAYKLWIDFGNKIGVKQSSAQITNYPPEDLIGKHIVAVTNLSPKQIANFQSEVLVLGVVMDNKDVILIAPDAEVPLGSRIW